MKILVDVGHPKHVHFFKNIIHNLIKNGHEIKITAKSKDITLYLLDAYGFDYEVMGINYNSLLKKAYGLIENDIKLYKLARRFKPDLLVGGNPSLSHISKLIGKPNIDFTDTEHASLANWLSFPFSNVILTPSSYKGKINPKKQIKYNGYEELAYLHPNYFKPDPSVLEKLELSKDDKFIVMRFVAWNASHDINDKGFDNIDTIIKALEKHCKIFITSESKMSQEYEKYRINIPPESIHHLLYYADLFIGESSSMACESAILGTPAIFVSTSRRGYTDELESRYDMLYNFSDPEKGQEDALIKAIELLKNKNTKRNWQKKRNKLLKEKIDVTQFMTVFIEGYPDTLK